MNKRIVLLGIALAGFALVSAHAQTSDSPPPRPLPPLLAALDADTNHVISAQEIANAPKALLTLDKNGDGKLTRDEFIPQRPEGAPSGQHPDGRKEFVPPIVAALDTDGDGVISATEIANAATALATLDKNGDGQLSGDEIMPHPPGGRDRGGHGGPGGPGGPPPGQPGN
jgi:hypothetical protein